MQSWQKYLLAGVSLLLGTASGQPIELITKAHQPSVLGAGDSSAAEVSADGRWVVFLSSANNLVTNDHNGLTLDVFLKDLQTGEMRLLSRAADGQNGGDADTLYAGISGDGRWVLLESDAGNLVAGDANEETDVFLWDNEAGALELVSRGLDGEPADGSSGFARFSGDGRYVVFESLASNLVENDENEGPDVFFYDRESGEITLVSVNSTGTGTGTGNSITSLGYSLPAVSADGKHVAFMSYATDLVEGTPASATRPHLFLRDVEAETTSLISHSRLFPATFSDLVFPAEGGTLVFGGEGSINGTSFTNALFYFDLGSQEVTSVALPIAGLPSGSEMFTEYAISADGRYAAFTFNGQLYLWDNEERTNRLLSASTNGVASNGAASYPLISADGGQVYFQSSATDLQPLPTHDLFQLYHYDRESQELQLISRSEDEESAADAELLFPSISADGQVVAWQAWDSESIERDDNQAYDLFVLSGSGAPEIISMGDPAAASLSANQSSRIEAGALSWDGRFLVFSSAASDLVPEDSNGHDDVFLHDLKSGETRLVSVDAEGAQRNGGSHSAQISGNGRYAAFLSFASFADNDTNALADLYVKDLESGEIELVSTATNGTTSLNTTVERFAISADGLFVAYMARLATQLNPSIYIRDRSENRVLEARNVLDREFALSSGGQLAFLGAGALLLNGATGETNAIPLADPWEVLGFTDDGAQLLLRTFRITADPSSTLQVYDLASGELRSVATNTASGVISPRGSHIAYEYTLAPVPAPARSGFGILDLLGEETLEVFPEEGVVPQGFPVYPPTFSRDGRWLAFSSRHSGIVPGDTNDFGDTYVFDLATESLAWVSRPPEGEAASGPSVLPLVSRDGSFIIFQSDASHLVASDKNVSTDIFLYRLPQTDSDGDGLDDGQEMMIFGSLEQTGEGDVDGDGFSNAFEIAAGTHPMEAASVLVLEASPGEEGTTIQWQAVPGQAYSIQAKDDVAGDWQTLSERLVATSGTASFTDSTPEKSQRFYRIILAE